MLYRLHPDSAEGRDQVDQLVNNAKTKAYEINSQKQRESEALRLRDTLSRSQTSFVNPLFSSGAVNTERNQGRGI